jgi:flagellar biosynthesis protein FlhG
MDQASGLREMVKKNGSVPVAASGAGRPVRVLTVSSGKGGVGKTNITANLALMMGRSGRRVLILDADLGLANIDVVLGISPPYNISHLLTGERGLDEVIFDGPWGIKILPAASGLEEMTHLSEGQKMRLLHEMEALDEQFDVLLIDTGAGISDNVLYFNLAADERLIVATNEPTSITDAYALIKVLHVDHDQDSFSLVVNQVGSENEAKFVYRKLAQAAEKFLGSVSLDYLGFIPADPKVVEAVRKQQAVVEAFPTSPASAALHVLAGKILGRPVPRSSEGNIRLFWRRLVGVSPTV